MEKDFESIIDIRNIFIEKIKENNMKNWQVLWPIRVLLSWEAHSPWAFEMIYILWIKESINRINKYKKDK
jgi:glutamyl/glutaminyl-tRNA synthetase